MKTRLDQARGAVFLTFLTSLGFLLCRFDVRPPGNVVVFQTVLLMSESVEGTETLINAGVNEFFKDAHPYHVELD